MKKRKQVPRRARRMGRDIWIFTARDALISGGIEAVKVERIAATLEAERGSFYHHFKNRAALLDEMLKHWEVNNNQAYEAAIDLNGRNGKKELEYINTMWLKEKSFDPPFDPAYDSAIREWARTSGPVRRVVRRVDNKRIAVLESIFNHLGYKGDDAMIRARIAYFHQVGYLSLGMGETKKRRAELAPLYFKVLLGK